MTVQEVSPDLGEEAATKMPVMETPMTIKPVNDRSVNCTPYVLTSANYTNKSDSLTYSLCIGICAAHQ